MQIIEMHWHDLSNVVEQLFEAHTATWKDLTQVSTKKKKLWGKDAMPMDLKSWLGIGPAVLVASSDRIQCCCYGPSDWFI